jgi:photosystem II reaction center protein Psb28
VRGVKETSVPEVRLTRARDGASGTATFVFTEPSIFVADGEVGDITGLYMEDDEGTISTVDVQVGMGVGGRKRKRDSARRRARAAPSRRPTFSTTHFPLLSIHKFRNRRPSSSTASPTASRPSTP